MDQDRETELKKLCSAVSVRPVGSENNLPSNSEHDLKCGLVGSTVGPPNCTSSKKDTVDQAQGRW
jgi:hypothetical protein